MLTDCCDPIASFTRNDPRAVFCVKPPLVVVVEPPPPTPTPTLTQPGPRFDDPNNSVWMAIL